MNHVVFAHELLESQVVRNPAALAVQEGERTVSYAELDARANRLARHLLARGVGAGGIVAVALPRSVELIVTLYAALKAGAAYIPLDVDHPAARVAAVLDDARPAVLLTTGSYTPATAVARLDLDAPGTLRALEALPGDTVTDDERGRAVRAEDPAYVIHTSGSTGTPKGVVVPHRGLAAYLGWALDAYPGLAGTALLHSAVSFDLTVTTLFGPLSAGGAVRVAPLLDPDGTADDAGTDGPVTFLKVTPSHLAVLDALPQSALATVDLVVGGEQLLGEQLDAWRRRAPGAAVTNEYGPTEATVGCVTHRVDPKTELTGGPVPIGRPAPGVRVHVLDEQLRPVAEGATGELFLAGDQLALGYLNRPDQTEERFVRDPFDARGARMYRTGDLVRMRPDGTLVFIGRKDQQVKIRSHRVEPGEVETALLTDHRVAQVCVTPVSMPGGLRLVAHVVPEAQATGERTDLAEGLRAYAASRLPSYLVPSAVVLVHRMPLTPQGKVDRAALVAALPPEPGPAAAADEADTAMTAAEKLLADLCAELLGVQRVGLDDNFFSLGGNSLLGIQLSAQARRKGLTLTPTDVFRSGSVRVMASRAEGTTTTAPSADRS
ncbi:non-ribosomal peptide synthetase [Streptomyces sp. NBC_01335]|uniref:non-ribosomal peptide synthetase n=1 Tax=Streptomyces sp. NBC_01335 TaxID=2903828 RepID=UPI002E122D7A|nr:non-ribosomal peptide synthetase [Streptomyces sp. NBC_01335]